MRDIGYRTWRALHWLAYASWPVALVHALGTGSDARVGWMQALGVALTAVVAAAVVSRLAAGRCRPARALAGAARRSCSSRSGTFLWYSTGPGAAGWAARAGTPASLLPHAAVVSAATLALARTGQPERVAAAAALRTPPCAAASPRRRARAGSCSSTSGAARGAPPTACSGSGSRASPSTAAASR